MKNTTQTKGQSSSGRFFGPSLDMEERQENQWLPVQAVMSALREKLAGQLQFAKVVGRQVCVTFPEAPSESVRFQLSQLGFNWNKAHQSWQHPCGQFARRASSSGSYAPRS
jgi:hypothetical protein